MSENKLFFEKFADFVVRKRFWMVLLTLIVAFAVYAGIPNLRLDTDGRVFMGPDNPDKQTLDLFEQEFAKDDNLNILLIPKDGVVFSPETLQIVHELTEDAWNLPYVRLVNSITRFQNSYSEEDMLVVEDLIPDPYLVSQAEAEAARKIALSRIEIQGSLINEQASMTAINIIFRLPGLNLASEIPTIMADANPLLQRYRDTYPDLQFQITGSVPLGEQFAVASQDDGQSLTPAMLLAMLLIVGFLLRTISGVFSVLLVATLSALISLGALGWSLIPLNSATAIAPLMIITLAVASTVHILSSVRQTMLETADKQVWATRAISEHGLAITVAVFTTAIGFLSLNFSISPPFQQLGNMVAAGMVGVWVFTMFLLPALICWLPMKQKKTSALTDKLIMKLCEWVIKNQKLLLLSIPVIIICFAVGISKIKLEDDFLRYFDERYEIRQATDFYEDNIGGLNVMEYPVETGVESGINSVEYLRTIEDFTEFLRAQPQISSVRSITDIIKRLNQNMNGDNTEFYKLPETDEEASQYLFLYELSLGYGMDLTDQINVDRSAVRITAYVPRTTTAELQRLDATIQDWFAENASELQSPVTGQTHVYTMISARDVPAMLQGTILALIFISGVILLVLRNVKLGFISLVPNLVPAAMAFGLWGYTVGSVTLAVSIVAAMTLGIVVDDTVHFLLKYANAKKSGKSPEESVRYAFKSVGMALTITSIGLVVGFVILGQSGFAVNRDLARLTAVTLAVALFVDFLFLPPLLIWIDKMKKTSLSTPIILLPLAFLTITPFTIMPQPALASAEKGLEIAEETALRDYGFGDFSVEGQMILKNKAGKESVRKFTTTTLENPDLSEGDKSVIVFSEPRDVKGTALLTHTKIEPEDDSQWIFLPAIKRTKRISSSNRTGKFVSSEFSYEDLGSEEVEDNEHIWLADMPCPTDESLTCAQVESRPKNARSGYSKRVSYTDLDEYRVHKIEFYNRRGDLEKVLTFDDYSQYLGQYWRSHKMIMENIQTGKSTKLNWGEYSFRKGLTEQDFTPQALERSSR